MRRIVLACAALALLASTAAAQTFPVLGKPLRLLVPVPAGSDADVQARLVAAKITAASGIPAFVENRSGASTLVALRELIASEPDGHTLLYTFSAIVVLPHLFRKPPFDYFKDVTPVMQAARYGLALAVHDSIPARNVAELVAYAKANPGGISFASSGTGTGSHIDGELLMRLGGIRMVHVPYRGSADALRDMLTGRVQLIFDPVATLLPNVRTGKLRMLAVGTEKRLALLPVLPTLREEGYDIAFDSWYGIYGPGGMSRATIEALHPVLARAVLDPETRDAFAVGGAEATAVPAAEFSAYARREYGRYGEVVRSLGISLD
jgi:tripartite-type tricarboxylate transporter receptor subunit TctC